MSAGLCENYRLTLERAIRDRLGQQPPISHDPIASRDNVHYLSDDTSQTYISRNTKDILTHEKSCWLCFRMWRSFFDPDARQAQNPICELPEKVDICLYWWPEDMRDERMLEEYAKEYVSIGLQTWRHGRFPHHHSLFSLSKSGKDYSTEIVTESTAHIYNFEAIIDNGTGKNTLSLCPVGKISHDDYLAKVHMADESTEPGMPNKTRLGTIQSWMQQCDCSHKCMHQTITSSAPGFVPPRLLHIGPDARRITLIDTEKTALSGRPMYATLSYCWGTEKPFRLTVDEFRRLTMGTSTQDLGRVFREAVYLVYELCISYIWIDSLCIIQDSPGQADWLKHAPLMHLIYGSSYLNVAASASRSWKESLWRNLEDVRLRPLIVNLPDGMTLYSQDPHTPQSLYSEVILGEDQCYSPLFTRGWCVQEFLFSRRTVHMVESQMFWQCQEINTAELLRPHPMVSWRNILKSQVHSSYTLDRAWIRLISEYVSTEVTFSADRYYALASTANWFEQEYRKAGVETRYLVGHWEHYLRESILWSNYTEAKHYTDLFIPSWSCLGTSNSFRLETNWMHNGSDDFCRLDNFLVDVEGINVQLQEAGEPFSPAQTGSIHLRGPLLRLRDKREKPLDEHKAEVFGDESWLEIWLSQGYSFTDLNDERVFEFPMRDENSQTAFGCLFKTNGRVFDQKRHEFIKSIVLAPIAYSYARNRICQLIYAIALEPCESSVAGAELTYRHCGSAVFSVSAPKGRRSFSDLKEMVEIAHQSSQADSNSVVSPNCSSDASATDEKETCQFEQSYRVVADLCEFVKKGPKQSFYLV